MPSRQQGIQGGIIVRDPTDAPGNIWWWRGDTGFNGSTAWTDKTGLGYTLTKGGTGTAAVASAVLNGHDGVQLDNATMTTGAVISSAFPVHVFAVLRSDGSGGNNHLLSLRPSITSALSKREVGSVWNQYNNVNAVSYTLSQFHILDALWSATPGQSFMRLDGGPKVQTGNPAVGGSHTQFSLGTFDNSANRPGFTYVDIFAYDREQTGVYLAGLMAYLNNRYGIP